MAALSGLRRTSKASARRASSRACWNLMAAAKWAITCNGPGETAGWLRPLLRALYAMDTEFQAHVFYVPDDYATGAEPEYVQRIFPQARVYGVKTYLAAALGKTPAGM